MFGHIYIQSIFKRENFFTPSLDYVMFLWKNKVVNIFHSFFGQRKYYSTYNLLYYTHKWGQPHMCHIKAMPRWIYFKPEILTFSYFLHMYNWSATIGMYHTWYRGTRKYFALTLPTYLAKASVHFNHPQSSDGPFNTIEYITYFAHILTEDWAHLERPLGVPSTCWSFLRWERILHAPTLLLPTGKIENLLKWTLHQKLDLFLIPNLFIDMEIAMTKGVNIVCSF